MLVLLERRRSVGRLLKNLKPAKHRLSRTIGVNLRQVMTEKKPAWMARKSCNYLMESVETCVPKMGPCFSEEGLKQEKDERLADALKQVKEHVKGWDSSKCPVAQEYEERLQAAVDAAAAEAAAAKTPEADPTGSSTAMTALVLSALILAIFI